MRSSAIIWRPLIAALVLLSCASAATAQAGTASVPVPVPVIDSGAAQVPETPRALPIEQAISRTLESPRYRFCADPKYPLLPDEIQWCRHLPRSPDARAARCPALLVACRAGATADLLHKSAPLDIHLPHLGGLGRLILWALVAASIVFIVFVIARGAMRKASRSSHPSDDATPGAAAQISIADNAQKEAIERDVDRLLARARAAAAAGDFGAAIADLHAALLRRLAGDGHVRIQAWATNGDYVRELRGRAPDLAIPVRDVVRVVEAAEFGARAANESVYQGLLHSITPLLARSAGLLTALVAFLMMSSSCVPSLRADWSASPSGSAAVIEFLAAVGHDAHGRLLPLRDLGQHNKKPTNAKHGDVRQIVLLPGAELGDPEWAVLHDWLQDADNTLLLATGGRVLPAWLKTIEVVDAGASGTVQATSALAAARTGSEGPTAHGAVPGAAWVRTGVPAGEVFLVRGSYSYALAAPNDVGRVIVFADPYLFTNASLAAADNAALLTALVDLGGAGAIEFVGEETGVVAPTPLASVSRGRLAPFLLQLGVCLVLFLLMQGRAFGRLVDPPGIRRRAFSEHVRALGTQYARAHAAGHVLTAYGTWAIERLRERIRLSGDRGIGDLSAAIAKRTNRPLGDVARVLFSVRRDEGAEVAGSADVSRAAVEQHLSMMRELGSLLNDVSVGSRERPSDSSRNNNKSHTARGART